MKQAIREMAAAFGRDACPALPDFAGTFDLGLRQAPARKTVWPDVDFAVPLEKITAELVTAYLNANQNFRRIPLKDFMDDIEKNILLFCLRLTHGSQRNAAVLLGLKPTALFEKMRKHSINGRQIKLSEKLQVLHPREGS